MARVILFDPAFPNNNMDNFKFNIGLLSIGSYLKSRGIPATVYYKSKHFGAALAEISTSDVMFVGISAMTVQYPSAITLAKEIKKLKPGLKIVLGGCHARLFPKPVLEEGGFDIVVTGDGERTSLEIYHSLAEGKSLDGVKGIGYRTGGDSIWTGKPEEMDLGTLPLMDYSVLYGLEPIRWYDGQGTMMVYSGNGCGHRCTFCINSLVGGRYRFRKIIHVVDEIEILQNEYGVTHFYPIDENFCASRDRFSRFLDLIEERGLKITWFIQNRVDTLKDDYLNQDVLRRMRALGCTGMLLGIESGSDHMLERMKKKMKSTQAIPAAQALVRAGIKPWLSLMIGMPDEGPEDYLATLRLVDELHKIRPYMVSGPALYRPIPGTKMYERALQWYPEDDKPRFSDPADFVPATLPIAVQAKLCTYKWIQKRKLLEEILTCIERFYQTEGFVSYSINSVKALFLRCLPLWLLKKVRVGSRHIQSMKEGQDRFEVWGLPLYFISFALYYFPAFRRYLLRGNRNPETFNPLLWFKWKKLLRLGKRCRPAEKAELPFDGKREHSYS